MASHTPLCHCVTSPPQGGRLGTRRGPPTFSSSVAASRSHYYVTWLEPLAPISPLAGEMSQSDRGGCHRAQHIRSIREMTDMPHEKIPPKLRSHAKSMRRVMTDAELKLWNELRAHRLMGLGFRRQMPIAGYIVDFACPSASLIVELDGSQHGQDAAINYDLERTRRLQANGWTVLRFWNDDVLKHLDDVCRHILKTAGVNAL